MKIAKNFSANEAKKLLDSYSYQPRLTRVLDGIKAGDKFDQPRINEIVLWKVNRYASIDDYVIASLNRLSHLTQGDHRQAADVLEKLLKTHGVRLPMASTLLRFRNRAVFQIIDERAYRAVYGKAYSCACTSNSKDAICTYFKYLDDVATLANQNNLEFSAMDRILYQFDKNENGPI